MLVGNAAHTRVSIRRDGSVGIGLHALGDANTVRVRIVVELVRSILALVFKEVSIDAS